MSISSKVRNYYRRQKRALIKRAHERRGITVEFPRSPGGSGRKRRGLDGTMR